MIILLSRKKLSQLNFERQKGEWMVVYIAGRMRGCPNYEKRFKEAEEDIIGEPTADVYRRYKVFCDENGLTGVSNKVFGKQICTMLDLESVATRINGKGRRIYKR